MEGKFLLAFNKAEILDLLEQASRWTCRNFAYTEEVVRGKITLLSKTPVTPEEAYAAFLAALNTNGIAMYQTGKYWKLVRIADAKKVPIPTILSDDGEVPALEQPITKLFRLRYVDPDQLRAVLGNFTSPQGADIQTIPPDILLVTDIGLNVRRIEKLLEALDRPGSHDLVRVIQVQYAPARDVADKVNQIFVQAPGAPAKSTRRPVIGGVAAPGAAPGAAPAGGTDGGEGSISKVVADERTNKLIVISDEKSYQRIVELVRQLDTPTAGEGSIHVIFLKNANAEDLSNTLQNLASGSRRTGSSGGPASPPPGVATMASPPGVSAPRSTGGGTAELFSGDVKVTADKPSNSLVIIASASDFAVVQRLIDKLDRPRRQVFVEAVIMEVDIDNTSDIGVGMHLAVPVNTPNGKGFIPIGLEPGKINSLNPSSALQLGGFLTGLVGPVSAELKDIFPFPSVGVVIQALQSNSDVNVLSTPHLIAQDNEEAEIIVGKNVPFQAGYNPGFNTGGLGTTTTGGNTTNNLLASPYAVSLIAPIQRQNVDLKLKIKPQIHEGDMVRMDIEESQEEIVANNPTLGPTTAKRSVKTKVVVKDQSTIVIGGLVQDRNVTSVSKIPLLGDIPILGWAFRSTNIARRRRTPPPAHPLHHPGPVRLPAHPRAQAAGAPRALRAVLRQEARLHAGRGLEPARPAHPRPAAGDDGERQDRERRPGRRRREDDEAADLRPGDATGRGSSSGAYRLQRRRSHHRPGGDPHRTAAHHTPGHGARSACRGPRAAELPAADLPAHPGHLEAHPGLGAGHPYHPSRRHRAAAGRRLAGERPSQHGHAAD